jgi:hypothetical protein
MNSERIEKFLSNPACRAGGYHTPDFARDFLYRLPKFRTPRMKLCDDGAIRLLWRRKGGEVKVYVRGQDVSFSVHSRIRNDTPPSKIASAMTVQRAMAMSLKWLAKN